MTEVENFIKESIQKIDAGSIVESQHTDDLLLDKYDEQNCIEQAFDLYRELLQAYLPYSREVKAHLIFTLEDGGLTEIESLDDLLNKKLILHSPPELYITKRDNDHEPYIVEEYKRPVKQNVIKTDQGCIYSYFRSHRNEPRDTFGRGFYFEHYLTGDVDHEWI